MAASLDEADRMIDAAERAGVVLMVAENVHFDPLLLQVKRLLAEGAIGEPAVTQITREAYLTDSFVTTRRWFLDARLAAGGIMMAGGIHDIATMRILVGEVRTVYAARAVQRFREMEGDDTSVAILHLERGVIGVLVESFVMKSLATASGSEVHRLRIDGELGSLSVQNGETIHLYTERARGAARKSPVETRIHVRQADTFQLEVAHFLEAISTGEEPISSGRSQRRPLEIVLAAYQSMATGLPVAVTAGPR
jgi:predicted dehydrogenase